MLNKIQNVGVVFLLLIMFSSCSTINFFTRMKKTPREYSLNYCGEDIKAPKTDLNKKVWVVFSDRDNNATYLNPGGKVKMKDLDFLQPLVVIKEKGDYLRVVKYDPEVIDPNLLSTKFKDRKKAEYYGWIHKSHVLLTRQSVTDIATGFKNKQITIISDTVPLNDPELYLSKDSIKVFKDVNLSIENKKIPFYEIVYTLKISSDRQKMLIAKKTEISPDSTETDVLGWIHRSLIKDIGQRLHVNTQNIQPHHYHFENRTGFDTLRVSDYAHRESKSVAQRKKSLKYSPVSTWDAKHGVLDLETSIPMPVLDQRDNYVFNVNGNKISYSKFKKLEKNLKNINLQFVFEGKEEVLQNYSAMVNVIQNLQPLFEDNSDGFNYKFGATIAVQGKDLADKPIIRNKPLTSDYTQFIESLITETNNLAGYKPLLTSQTWSGVRAATEALQKDKDDTNIMIIMGESGYSESVDTLLLNKITNANCRILGFQLHGENNNASNNFVLQIENMINYYANNNLSTKREIIVYVDQLRKQNKYKESSKNVYKLDFPGRTMSQGWILFPEKDVTLTLDILTNSIDSLISEVKSDNNTLTNSLYKAFATVGNHRYKYDSLFVDYFNPTLSFNKKLPSYFSEAPAYYLPSKQSIVLDTLNPEINYQLLLSKEELDELNLFIDFLSINEVDYTYKGKKQTKNKRYCNCPDDEDYINNEVKLNNPSEIRYKSTRKIRKKLEQLYLNELKTCKLCKVKTKDLKNYTLAEAQRRITGSPAYSPLLERYRIKDIKNKNKISDKELDELITYFKLKKKKLNEYLHNADKFDSDDQTYYWIDQALLP